jgi:hypothetical protein
LETQTLKFESGSPTLGPLERRDGISGIQSKPIRQADDFAGWVNGGDCGLAFGNEFIFVKDLVVVFNPNALGTRDRCFDGQQVVIVCGPVVFTRDMGDDQKDSFGFEVAVSPTRGAQHFDSGDFKIIDVVGVMDSALSIGLLIPYSDADFVMARNDWGRIDRGHWVP